MEAIIKYSRLVEDDGGFDGLRKDLDKLGADLKAKASEFKGVISLTDPSNSKEVERLQTEIEVLKKAMNELTLTTKILDKAEKEHSTATKENSKIQRENADVHAKASGTLDELRIRMEQHKYALKAVNQMEKEGLVSVEEATIARGNAKDMMAQLSKEIRNQEKIQEAKNIIDKNSTETLIEVRERMAALRTMVQNTSTTTEEGKNKIKKYNDEIDALTDKLEGNSDKFIKNKINVGNYTESIKEALRETTLFGVNLGQVGDNVNKAKGFFTSAKEGLKDYIGQLKQSASAQNGMTVTQRASAVASTLFSGALKVLKFALISTGIGAIVVLLGSLIAYFSGTQDGADKLTRIMEPLKAIFHAFMGVLENVGRYLVSAFENPKKAMNDLYQFVKQNLINRFKAFGVILEGIINLDFKKVADGVLQAGTGVENLTSKISETAKATNKMLDDAIKKGQMIADLNAQIGRQQIKYERSQLTIGNLIEDQQLIANDMSRTMEEREKAVREIIRLSEKLGGEEAEIIKKKIQALKLEYSLKGAKNLTNEEQHEMIELEKQLDDAQDRGYDATMENLRIIEKFKKEQHDKQMQRIKEQNDAMIKQANDELALFLAKQGWGAKSFEEQIKIEEGAKNRRLKILEAENKAGKLTALEYQAKKLEIQNDFASKTIALTDKIISYETELKAKQSETLLSNTKYINDAVYNAEIERINKIAKERTDVANFLKFIGVKTERELNDALEQIAKERKDAQQKANEDLKKNRLEVAKATIDEQQKIELGTVNEKLNKTLSIDVSGSSKSQREKVLKDIEDIEKQKAEIEAKYQSLRTQNRISEIDAELLLVEKNSIREIELTAEKNKLISDLEKKQQEDKLKEINDANKKAEDLYKKYKDVVKSTIDEIFKAITESFQKQVQLQEKAVENQNKLVDKQSERAKLGLENTLAFEQRELAKREAEKIKAQKKLERAEKIKALWTSYSKNAENKDEKNPVLKTLRDFAILEAISASFGEGGLAEDKIPTDGRGITRGRSHRGRNGGIPVLIEGNEGFFSGREVSNLGKENFYAIKEMAGRGPIEKAMFKQQRERFVMEMPGENFNDNRIVDELKGLKEVIASKPSSEVNLPEVVDGILTFVETVTQGNKTKRNHYKIKRPRL